MRIDLHDNFLTPEECQELIKRIDKDNKRSTVVGEAGSTVSKNRTSSTCNLWQGPIVDKIRKQTAELVGCREDQLEAIQGQKYEVGQYFRHHHDWFSGDGYNQNCLASGQRTHTLMVYLNDDLKGGETKFHTLDIVRKPKQGQAMLWTNMYNGRTTEESLHSGEDVLEGTKYILTIWARENTWDNAEDQRLYQEKRLDSRSKFSSVKDLPPFSENGWFKMRVQPHIWEHIEKMYESVKKYDREETFGGKNNTIPGKGVTSTIMPFDYIPEEREKLHKMLQPDHEAFCGQRLEPTFIYGARSYKKGASLVQHRDKIETHHISSIVMLEKDLDGKEDWTLDIQQHDGQWVNVTMEPGEMLFYESAKCSHGRDKEFQGKFYTNFYVHYKLVDFEYVQ